MLSEKRSPPGISGNAPVVNSLTGVWGVEGSSHKTSG